jgi:hypothetical protein
MLITIRNFWQCITNLLNFIGFYKKKHEFYVMVNMNDILHSQYLKFQMDETLFWMTHMNVRI